MFKTVAIAGTFDRLHKGHRYFISNAFKLGHKVLIGLTSDRYVEVKLKVKSGKLKVKVNNYEMRKKELEGFLKQKGLLERAEIVKIEDVYGSTIDPPGSKTSEAGIEALVVTVETLEGAAKVNKKRQELGLKSLEILQVPLILAEDEKRIASTRIRYGEIDREGKIFLSRITSHLSRIDEELRQKLKKPLGLLIKGNPENLNDALSELRKVVAEVQPVMVSTVGDEVTRVCNEAGITVNLAIVDYKVKREKKYSSLSDLGFTPPFARGTLANGLGTVKNPPGHITRELVDAVKDAYLGIIKDGRQRIIEVEGEEDLAGVPAILLAPLGSVVFYGQPACVPEPGLRRGKPAEGVVVVEVTEEIKEKLLGMITKVSS